MSKYFEPWVEYATCRSIGNDIFFPEIGQDWKGPQKVCAACPVRLLCLDSVMRYEQGRPRHTRYGMAGGLTPSKREKYEPEWLAEQVSAA